MDTSFSSQSTGFLLASRRAFTPESSLIPTSLPGTPITISFTEDGAVVVNLESEIPETPQVQLPPISPPPLILRNLPATYKERVGIHALRYTAGFTLDIIITMMHKPIKTINDICQVLVTPPRRSSNIIFHTPDRRALVAFIESDPVNRRLFIGEVSHQMGYTCSEATIRRALTMENLFRFIAKSQPFIKEMNRVCRIYYVDRGLALPFFH
jgi:hypothetical protein